MDLLEQFKEALKLEQEGKFQEALTVYTSIITVDNSFRAALLNLGSLYYRMKRYNEALDSFMGALKLKEDYIVLFNIGTLFFRIGQYKKAIVALNQCKKLNSDFVIALLVKGIAFSKLNHYKAALACFKEVLVKNPENKVALTAIVLLFYEQKNYSGALYYLRKYEGYYASFRFKDIAQDIILKCARHESAELIHFSLQKKEFKKFDEFVATVPETIFNDSKGDIASKIKHLEKHIRTTPEAESLLSLSLCYLFQGNSQKAIYYLAQVTQSS